MNNVTAVIFDMDGLMFDTESLYYRASQTTADKLGLPFSKEYYLTLLGRSDKEIMHKYQHDFKDERLVKTFVKDAYTTFEQIVIDEGIPVKKGLPELLHYLDQEKIPKVVASSNTKNKIQNFLKRETLLDAFDGIISGEEVTHAKPNPEIFERAFQMAGGHEKKQTLILEDSMSGIRAAYDAQIPCIMVPDMLPPTPEAKEKTIHVMEDLFAVKDFIIANR